MLLTQDLRLLGRLLLGAAQGVVLLALLGILWSTDMNRANGAKNVLAGIANIVSATIFISSGTVDWMIAILIGVGSAIGGWLGARIGLNRTMHLGLALQVRFANRLAAPLRTGTLTTRDLAAVQRRRLPPVRVMQPIQLQLHKRVANAGPGVNLPHPLPARIRFVLHLLLPIVRRVAARVVGRGIRPERVSPQLRRLFDTR